MSTARSDLARLRGGEVVAAVAGLALLALMFLVPWYGAAHGSAADGWNTMPVLRWVAVVTALAGLLLAVLQAVVAAPAVPASASMIVTVVGGLTTLLLAIRLVAGSGDPKLGAFLGLLAAAALTAGAWRSMRQESGWVPGVDRQVPTVSLGPPPPP
ncbi:MAG: hypothetical protein ACLP50_12450 [Solirubrobacteraceae bacterium]